jgi:hypothetical protein
VFLKVLIAATVSLGLWSCTSLPPLTGNDATQEYNKEQPGNLPDGKGWWYARFHIDWPEGEEINWYVGTLIGGEVIAPTYAEYHQDVPVWRVHRRAGRDGYGHVFSFIFYSTPQTAQRIYNTIQNHALVQTLLKNGRLTKVTVDDVTRITRPNIEDTSDDSWPVSVQKTWPALIMGSSRMWLELVTELASHESSVGGIEAKYKKVQDDITLIWREEGQHAILHHLNAIYAYQPLLIRY